MGVMRSSGTSLSATSIRFLLARTRASIFAGCKPSKTGNGAIYNFKEPSEFASKPVGERQKVEVTMVDSKITMILNGKKIHDAVECNKATGAQLDGNVKEPGAFFLQGAHGSVWFRNIRVKELAK